MNGFYCVNKPTGLTSSDVVGRIRRITNQKRVGHMGTLDPGACGVLPIAVSKCARLFDYLTDKEKSYRAEFIFGQETDTLDSYGKITNTCQKEVTKEEINKVIGNLRGRIMQLPPIYSALSINGVRAYDLARNGQSVELKPREIDVYSFDLKCQTQNGFMFDISCGKGTYIRSLVRDLAYLLGTVGYMSMLIRTKSGVFNLDNSKTLDEIEEDSNSLIMKADFPVMHLDKIELSGKRAEKLLNGVGVDVGANNGQLYRVYVDGEFVGLGQNKKRDMFAVCCYLKED